MNRNPDGVTYRCAHRCGSLAEWLVFMKGRHGHSCHIGYVGAFVFDAIDGEHKAWVASDWRGRYCGVFDNRHAAATIIRNRWVAETRES